MNIPGSFQPVTNLMYNDVDEMALPLESVAGFATLAFSPLPMAGATPTGLLNTAQLYEATVNIDGTDRFVSFAGSAAQTFTDMVTQILADVTTWATVALAGDEVVITSKSTGILSAVIVTDVATTGGALPLFSSVNGVNYKLLSNKYDRGHVKYLRWSELDFSDQAEMLALLPPLDPTSTPWVAAAQGLTIVKDTPAPLSMFEAIGIAAGTYTLDVTVDSVLKHVAFAVPAGATIDNAYESFALAMKTAFPTAGVSETQTDANTLTWLVTSPTVSTSGNVTVAAGTTGTDFVATVTATTLTATAGAGTVAAANGTVGTVGDGTPIAATAGHQDVTVTDTPAATGATTTAVTTGPFTFNATIDGTAHAGISITVTTGDSYSTIAAAMQAALRTATGHLETVTFVTSPAPAFRVTSATTGATSTVAVTDGTLFAAIAAADTATVGFAAAVQGTDAIPDASFLTVLSSNKALNGASLISSVGPAAIIERENKPQQRYLTRKDATYWNGSAWVVWTA